MSLFDADVVQTEDFYAVGGETNPAVPRKLLTVRWVKLVDSLLHRSAMVGTSPTERSMWRQALDTVRTGRPSREAIAARAYEKHLANPATVDRSVENWLDAERELLAEIRSRI